jgi:hypothetical protein
MGGRDAAGVDDENNSQSINGDDLIIMESHYLTHHPSRAFAAVSE